nr:hypothetical protein [Treponema sp.]
MNSGQKVAFSLLLSVLAFSVFTVLAFSGLFDLLEVNFYQPVVREIKEKKLQEIENAQNEYFETLIKRFDAFTRDPYVKTYLDSRPSEAFQKKRESLRASLLTESETSGLKGIRIIDDNGRNVYFSSFSSDLISGKRGVEYRNYNKISAQSYDSIRAIGNLSENSSPLKKVRVIKDGKDSQIIFSVPFYNKNSEFKATALFYCDAGNFSQFLFNKSLIDITGFATLLTEDEIEPEGSDFGGFVFGLPNYGETSIKKEIIKKWQDRNGEKFWKLTPVEVPGAEKSGELKTLCAFSSEPRKSDYGYITFLYDDSELKFPQYMRILLLVTAFITFYLTIFLILSFKHDDLVIIRDRVRRYENEFFVSYKKMGEDNPAYLAERKPVLERRILKALGKKGEKHAAEFKSIFEGYWQEMLINYGGQNLISQSSASPINADELKEIVRSSLEYILENGNIQINTVSGPAEKAKKRVEHKAHDEDFAEIAGVETIPETNSNEGISNEGISNEELGIRNEQLDESIPEAESVDEIEEIPEAEEADSNEELGIRNEQLDESIPEAESVDELEEIDSVEELDESIHEAESVDELEEIDSLDELDESIPEAESVDELE